MTQPEIMLESIVRAALLEDLGRAGDITSEAIIPADARWKSALVARKDGVVAGLGVAETAFRMMDGTVAFSPAVTDGSGVKAGAVLAVIDGKARGILAAERVALNFLGHLGGIATATRGLVEAVKPHAARICCTRKTTPTLRSLEKYAVRMGGGYNHRFGLDDGILIKDNHIAVAGGVRQALKAARSHAGHMVKIEIEVDTLAQLEEALETPPDAVLLDNMDANALRDAVKMTAGRCVTEASGGVTASNVAAIAAAGVDIISAGWITHSAAALDIGLDAAD